MAKDWKEISTDELCNYDGDDPAVLACYQRIIQHAAPTPAWKLQGPLEYAQ